VALQVLWLLVALPAASARAEKPAAPPAPSFEIVFLAGDFTLPVAMDESHATCAGLAKLTPDAHSYTVTGADLDRYDWKTQEAWLSAAATGRLLAGAQQKFKPSEEREAYNKLDRELGWGSELRFALADRAFQVRVGGEVIYAGAVVDSESQLAF